MNPHVILIFATTLALSAKLQRIKAATLPDTLGDKKTLSCLEDADCARFELCQGGGVNINSHCKCSLKRECQWARPETRPRWRRSVDEGIQQDTPDIGPDTCGKDRHTLSQWFLSHGMPELLLDPIPALVLPTDPNPYDDPNNPPLPPDQIPGYCGLQWSPTEVTPEGLKKYTLKDFPSEEAVAEAGFTITHKGQCGSCSTLQDLGVYIGQNLTSPVRRCGLEGIVSKHLMTECLKRIGFSDNCIPIWEDNTLNTRAQCFWPCLKSWATNEPFNKPDGSLNDCLQCDEDNSGPNFKYFSGRTRRNSGIPSSIHRPASTVYNMTHCYWYGDL